jgi:hypothetical protein
MIAAILNQFQVILNLITNNNYSNNEVITRKSKMRDQLTFKSKM